MKLKVISYDGRVLLYCPFKDEAIGSVNCGKCKYHDKGKRGRGYVWCNKASDTKNLLTVLEYKDFSDTSYWFVYNINSTKGNVENLTHLHNAYKNYLKADSDIDIDVFLDRSKHIIGQVRQFGIGKKYNSLYSLRQYLHDRDILKTFINMVRDGN